MKARSFLESGIRMSQPIKRPETVTKRWVTLRSTHPTFASSRAWWLAGCRRGGVDGSICTQPSLIYKFTSINHAEVSNLAMLKAHLDAVEQQLLATSKIPANAGHTLHRGTPREAFLKEFLSGHLSDRLAVGTGEIIDANSAPRQPRNQYDIVLFRAEFPRIDLGGGINAFLAESVVATIEVKSLLTQPELDTATQSASNAKKLTRNLITSFSSGYVPPGILSYVVAYDGPAQANTVQNWLVKKEASLSINQQNLPPTLPQRIRVPSEGLDGVFCLGKYSVIFDNAPITPINDINRTSQPNSKRWVTAGVDGNLLNLFLLLTQASANIVGQWADLFAYVKNAPLLNVQFLP